MGNGKKYLSEYVPHLTLNTITNWSTRSRLI